MESTQTIPAQQQKVFISWLLSVFPPHLTLMWLPLRAGAEVSSHGVMLSRGLGHTSFPPAASELPKPCQHTAITGGVLLRSGGRLRREVTVGCDSGGRCQASFRICSLRSSCCIFYWRNKGTACYFHTRAISLRAAAKETRWEEEAAERKQTSSFRNTKRLRTQTSVAASLLVMFLGSKVASDGSAGGLFANSSSRQING